MLFRCLTYTQRGYIILYTYIPCGGIHAIRPILKNDESGEYMSNTEENNEKCPMCSGKHKDREDKELKDLINRLKRIEGQVRGIEGMVESGAYCTDILMQVSAITSALNSFNKVLLANHVKTCVADNIRSGNDDVIDELVTTLQKLMK